MEKGDEGVRFLTNSCIRKLDKDRTCDLFYCLGKVFGQVWLRKEHKHTNTLTLSLANPPPLPLPPPPPPPPPPSPSSGITYIFILFLREEEGRGCRYHSAIKPADKMVYGIILESRERGRHRDGDKVVLNAPPDER